MSLWESAMLSEIDNQRLDSFFHSLRSVVANDFQGLWMIIAVPKIFSYIEIILRILHPLSDFFFSELDLFKIGHGTPHRVTVLLS